MLERFDETDCKCGLPVEIQADCVKLRDRVTQLEGELKRYAGCGHDHSTAWWQLRCEDTENDKVILQRHLQESAEQLGKLQANYDRVLGLVQAATKLLTELTIIPIGCSREQELAWKKAVKDLRAASLPAQRAKLAQGKALIDRMAHINDGCECRICKPAQGGAVSKPVTTCNRHSDCDAADEKARAKGALNADHCHDDCCSECFGN